MLDGSVFSVQQTTGTVAGGHRFYTSTTVPRDERRTTCSDYYFSHFGLVSVSLIMRESYGELQALVVVGCIDCRVELVETVLPCARAFRCLGDPATSAADLHIVACRLSVFYVLVVSLVCRR